MATSKPKLKKKRTAMLKLGTRHKEPAWNHICLLQLANMIKETMINVARRLLHIDIFTKNAIEKSIFDVGLVKGPLVGQRKYNTNNNSLNNKAKSISIVKTRDLSVTLGNKMSLESLDRAIRKIFGSKHPFGAPNVGVGRAKDQNPGASDYATDLELLHSWWQARQDS